MSSFVNLGNWSGTESVIIAGESNIGFGRSKNEDNYALAALPGFPSSLAVVADGIGGYSDGEVASACCCRWVLRDFVHRGAAITLGADAGVFLAESIGGASRRIYLRNEFDCREHPMGCAILGVVFTPEEVAFCGAGDCRLYEFSPSEAKLRQLSSDDVASDRCTLCNAAGIRYCAELRAEIIRRKPDCFYILCSDGLHHFVADDEIAAILGNAGSPRRAVSLLMRRAILRKAGDNITVVVARD